MALCSVGCGVKATAKGMCDTHYRRVRKYGDPLGGPPPRGAGPYLDNLVVTDRGFVTPCWLWQGATYGNGYGHVGWRVGGEKVDDSTHRASYAIHVAPIPEGFTIDHLCRQITCLRPSHLEAVTFTVNVQRSSRTTLDETKARAIGATKGPAREVAERFGVAESTVRSIRTGARWANVTGITRKVG